MINKSRTPCGFHRWDRQVLLLLLLLGSLGGIGLFNCQAGLLTIAAQGKSVYSLVVPKLAAESVNDAAGEMQRDILEATGADLPILRDDETIQGPFVSLGATKQAAAAGISAAEIPDEGFRIVTLNGNLFIVGLDTTTVNLIQKGGGPMSGILADDNVKEHPEIPGPAYTKNQGLSNGTANGVYSFLEKSLGVRWLMPGDLGRVVPRMATFEAPEMDLTERPGFLSRRMLAMSNGAPIGRWRLRHKLGYSFQQQAGHSWVSVIPVSMYDERPDWFAMNAAGERPRPKKGDPYYKIEATNSQVVEHFAETAIKVLKANPRLNAFSISPSDGSGWSQSPESKALYETLPAEFPYGPNPSVSVTPMVLKFYHDVSEIVAKEYPQGKISGYVGYTSSRWPPLEGRLSLPENFTPEITDLGFGYRYYDPEVRKTASALYGQWGKVAPAKWFAYALPVWLRSPGGLVQPGSPDNLNFLFQDLFLKNHIAGMGIYGNYAWDQAAMSNYLEAKMLWDPSQDANAIQKDWLVHAYGPQAGAKMMALYGKMDDGWFRPRSYNLDETFFKENYGPHYPEMEKMFLDAWGQPMTDKQKQRLALIWDNFILLQWRLRNAGYLPANYDSELTRKNKEISRMLSDTRVPVSEKDNTPAFFKFFGLNRTTNIGAKPINVKIGRLSSTEDKASSANSEVVMLYPMKDMEITINVGSIYPGSALLFYAIYESGKPRLKTDILYTGAKISFQAKANTPYYFQEALGGMKAWDHIDRWSVSVTSAKAAEGNFHEGTLTLQQAEGVDLYVYAPPELPVEIHEEGPDVIIQSELAKPAKALQAKAARAALKEALRTYEASLVKPLDRDWKFMTDFKKAGQKAGYDRSDFQDESWQEFAAIGYWQDQGFTDYHGTAWYRKSFPLPAEALDPLALNGKRLLLFFGAVDGDAVIYLNNQKIFQHNGPDLPNGNESSFVVDGTDALQVGKNTLAVQVTKNGFSGGIYKGVYLLQGSGGSGENVR